MFTVCCVSCKYLFLGFVLIVLRYHHTLFLFLPVVPSISFFLVAPHASLFFLICSWPCPPRSLYFLLSSCSSLVHFSSCFHSSFFLFRFSSSTLIPCLFHFSCFSSRFFSVLPHLLLALSSFTLYFLSSSSLHFSSCFHFSFPLPLFLLYSHSLSLPLFLFLLSFLLCFFLLFLLIFSFAFFPPLLFLPH